MHQLNLKLGKKQVLVGQYPTMLDIGTLNLEFEIFSHLPDVYNRARRKNVEPQANLTIANSETLEILRIPSNYFGMSYVLVENCNKLKRIEIYTEPVDAEPSQELKGLELKWLTCRNLPELEALNASGMLLSLQVKEVPKLRILGASNCSRLQQLLLENTPCLREINLEGCKKLPWALGLTDQQEAMLLIESKIYRESSGDAELHFPLKDLSHLQVQRALDVINQGLQTDFNNKHSNDESDEATITQYSINLLRPLEHVYTGGTGEQYAFELVIKHGALMDDLIAYSEGYHSPEDCLSRALLRESEIAVRDGCTEPTESDVFGYLATITSV